jgi:uncharacterized protein with NRDE domain
MCLILIAHQMTEQMPLLVLANRDEFYSRPTAAAERWDDSPGLIAGRDLASGGTWFGACGSRWASVTNIREGVRGRESHSRSRGWLVRDYLMGGLSPAEFLTSIKSTRTDFAGFNLLLGNGKELWYSSSRDVQTKALDPGIYGLSNHLLDTPWPKVIRAKEGFSSLLGKTGFSHAEAFALLADTTRAADEDLPDTGIPLDWERALSAIFITMPEYGTRCSTLLLAGADGRRFFTERRFAGGPHQWEESQFSWPPHGSLLDR